MAVTTPSFWAAKWDCQMEPFSWLNTPHCPMEITLFRAPFAQWELQIRWSCMSLKYSILIHCVLVTNDPIEITVPSISQHETATLAYGSWCTKTNRQLCKEVFINVVNHFQGNYLFWFNSFHFERNQRFWETFSFGRANKILD